ncbi:hypothetical protein HMPREF9999_00915 [Alloprevotella sp. oral taxon 473 str. F0040]|nr:hypothetical protein HMPREF9999_00915 [Alloprevotella sp. oral taxon 473 str. F0040]
MFYYFSSSTLFNLELSLGFTELIHYFSTLFSTSFYDALRKLWEDL